MSTDADEFDLEAARRARSSTPDDERPRCPECGSRDVHSKVVGQGHGRPREYREAWRCYYCTAHFDEPDYPGDRP